MMAEDR